MRKRFRVARKRYLKTIVQDVVDYKYFNGFDKSYVRTMHAYCYGKEICQHDVNDNT